MSTIPVNAKALLMRHIEMMEEDDNLSLVEDYYCQCAVKEDGDSGYNLIVTDDASLLLIKDSESTFLTHEDVLQELPEDISSLVEYAEFPIKDGELIHVSSAWWAFAGDDIMQAYGGSFANPTDNSESLIMDLYDE